MAEPYLVTSDSHFTRSRTGIVGFTIRYAVTGPVEAGGPEPYEVLTGWKPASRPLDLPEVDRAATKRSDGEWDLDITFEGIPAGAKTAGFAELDHSSVDSPFEEHPKFKELARIYGAAFDQMEGGAKRFTGWKPTITDKSSGKPVQNPLLGQTHFYDGNTVLRVCFAHPKYFAGLFKNLCKIETPIVPEGQKQLSETFGNKTWLKRSVHAQWRGNVWDYTLTYMLGVWNEDVYRAELQAVVTIPPITGPDGTSPVTAGTV